MHPTITATLRRVIPAFRGKAGVFLGKNETHFDTFFLCDGSGDLSKARALTIAGTVLAAKEKLYWTFNVEPPFKVSYGNFSKSFIPCLGNGEPIKTFLLKFKDKQTGHFVKRHVGIQECVAQVTALFGTDRDKYEWNQWNFDIFHLGADKDGEVELRCEQYLYPFPEDLISAVLLIKKGSLPEKSELMQLVLEGLESDRELANDLEKLEALKLLAQVMVVTFLQVNGLEAELTVLNPETKMEATTAPTINVEAPALAALEAPAPEASAIAIEAPAPAAEPEHMNAASIPEVEDKPEAKPRHLAVAPNPDPTPPRDDKKPKGGRNHTAKKPKPKHTAAGKKPGHDDTNLVADAR